MSGQIVKTALADGVEGIYISNPRFKTTRISVNLIAPMSFEDVSKHAMIPFLLTRGSRSYPRIIDINRKLAELYGAGISAGAVKLGDRHLLRMTATVLNDEYTLNGEAVTAQAGGMLTEMLFDPPLERGGFAPDRVAQEKRLLLEKIEGEINNKRRFAITRCESLMCEGEPYGIPVYGSREMAEEISASDIYGAWQHLLNTASVKIYVIGATEPSKIFDGFKAAFAGRSRAPKLPENKTLAARSEPAYKNETMEVAQGKLCIGFRTPGAGNGKDLVKLAVMSDMFGGGPYSLLFTNVREKLGLCYYCAARYNRHKGILMVDSGVEADKAEQATDEILRQMDNIRHGEFEDNILSASKMGLADSLRTVPDTPSATEAYYLDGMFDENPMSPEEYAEAIGSVTKEDIISAAESMKLDTVYFLSGGGEAR
ncbi:MAG TPA: insulinase family protein [Ruminococcaceae bacterium]|nr:insulinase family protein [Oscillospiraceae bacterium]